MRFLISKSSTQRFVYQCLPCACCVTFPQPSEGQHQSAQVLFWQLGHLCKWGSSPLLGRQHGYRTSHMPGISCEETNAILAGSAAIPAASAPRLLSYLLWSRALWGSRGRSWASLAVTVSVGHRRWWNGNWKHGFHGYWYPAARLLGLRVPGKRGVADTCGNAPAGAVRQAGVRACRVTQLRSPWLWASLKPPFCELRLWTCLKVRMRDWSRKWGTVAVGKMLWTVGSYCVLTEP